MDPQFEPILVEFTYGSGSRKRHGWIRVAPSNLDQASGDKFCKKAVCDQVRYELGLKMDVVIKWRNLTLIRPVD